MLSALALRANNANDFKMTEPLPSYVVGAALTDPQLNRRQCLCRGTCHIAAGLSWAIVMRSAHCGPFQRTVRKLHGLIRPKLRSGDPQPSDWWGYSGFTTLSE